MGLLLVSGFVSAHWGVFTGIGREALPTRHFSLRKVVLGREISRYAPIASILEQALLLFFRQEMSPML